MKQRVAKNLMRLADRLTGGQQDALRAEDIVIAKMGIEGEDSSRAKTNAIRCLNELLDERPEDVNARMYLSSLLWEASEELALQHLLLAMVQRPASEALRVFAVARLKKSKDNSIAILATKLSDQD
jgi:hypothetical protein